MVSGAGVRGLPSGSSRSLPLVAQSFPCGHTEVAAGPGHTHGGGSRAGAPSFPSQSCPVPGAPQAPQWRLCVEAGRDAGFLWPPPGSGPARRMAQAESSSVLRHRPLLCVQGGPGLVQGFLCEDTGGGRDGTSAEPHSRSFSHCRKAALLFQQVQDAEQSLPGRCGEEFLFCTLKISSEHHF